MIALRVNGRDVELDSPTPLLAYLDELGVNSKAVAVEHNGVIIDRDSYPTTLLNAGDVVDARALATASRLATLLPGVGVTPRGVEWSSDFSLEIRTQDGWRARFDSAGDIERQVDSLRAIRDYLASTRTSAEVIDVRFGDRPYYR